MQNPFSHGGFRDRSRPFIVVVLVLAGLLVVGAFFAKPVWRGFKDRRALKFVAAARAAITSDDFSVSVAQLRAAHALSPFHPEVLRATGEHFSRLSRAEGLVYWRQLADSGQMSDPDRFAFVRLAIDCSDFESARMAVIPLGTTRPKDPDALRLLAEVYMGFDQLELAASTLREAIDVAPFRSDLQVVLSRIELAGADTRLHSAAKGRLWQDVALGGTIQTEAASALLQSAALSPTDLRLLDSLIRPAPEAAFEQRLLQLLVRLRLPGADRERLIAGFRQATGLREESAHFQQLLTSLTVAKEFAAVTNLLPLTTVEKQRDLYPFRLEALAGLRDGVELQTTLKLLGERVGPAQASIYEAMAASFAGRTNESKARWQNSVSRNASNPAVLKIVAERAEQEGMREAAVQAWEGLLLQPEYAVRAARQVIRLSQDSTDARPAIKAYAQLVRLFPGNREPQLQLSFLRLLYGIETEAAKAVLAEPVQEGKLRAIFAAAAGLAALREDRLEAAAAHLDSGDIDWRHAPRPWRIVRAAALAKSGQYSEARKTVAGILPEELSPPELTLAGELMKKADR